MADKDEKTTTTSWKTYAMYAAGVVGVAVFVKWLTAAEPVVLDLKSATVTTTINVNFPDFSATATHSGPGVPTAESLVSGMKIAPLAGALSSTVVPRSALSN
jgi:hypothetical protein